MCVLLLLFIFFYFFNVFVFGSKITVGGDFFTFLPAVLVIAIHFVFFDQFNYFGFEGVFLALFLMVVPFNSNLLIKYNLIEVVLENFIASLAVASFLYASFSVIDYIFWAFDGVAPLISLIPSGFANIRYWSHVATWVLPLFPLFLVIDAFRGRYFWRALMTITAGIWWWIVFLSMAQGTILSVLIASVITLGIFGRSIKYWCLAFLSQMFLGVVLFALLSVALPEIWLDRSELASYTSNANVSIRLLQWREALAMSLENFPFGMGGQSWLTHAPITKEYAEANLPLYAHPHNMYLMWAAEYGWVFLTSFVIILTVAFRRLFGALARKEESTTDQWLFLAAFTASVGAACIHAFVSSVFLMPASMLVGIMVLSLFWALISERCLEAQRGSTHIEVEMNPLLKGMSILVFLFFSFSVLQSVFAYHKNMDADQACFHKIQKNMNLPRFWLHGYYPRDGVGSICESEKVL